MRTLTLRRAAAVAVLPLALSSLAACGGNSSTAVATDPQAGTSSSSPATEVSAPSDGSTVDSAAFLSQLKAAAKAITTTRFSMTMDFSGQSIKTSGAMDMTGGSPALQMSMTLPGTSQATDMLLVGGNIYIQSPGTGSAKYLKMDLSDPNNPLGSLGDSLGSLDPNALMDQMSPDAFKKVTYVGSDSVGKHYTVQLDTTSLPMLKGLPSSATSSIPRTMNYDLWLDDQGRMTQFKILLKNVMQMTAEYTDFGASVDIKAPDPSEVESMPSIPSASAG